MFFTIILYFIRFYLLDITIIIMENKVVDDEAKTRERKIYRVTLMGSAINVVLLVLKFAAGILGNSAAMIADAVHSLSDFHTYMSYESTVDGALSADVAGIHIAIDGKDILSKDLKDGVTLD